MKYLKWDDGELTNQEIAREIAQEMVEGTKIFKKASDWWK